MTYTRYFIYIILLLPIQARADTILQGKNFFNSETLTKAKSPYIIKGDINIHPNTTVKVEKGTKLIFDGGSMFVMKGGSLYIDGISLQVQNHVTNALIAGDKANIHLENIHIEGEIQPLVQAWNHSSIYIDSIIQDSYSNQSGIYISIFDHSSSTIKNLNISHWAGTGIQVFKNSNIDISDSFFDTNGKSLEIFEESKLKLSNSEFYNNRIGLAIWDSEATIHQNDFEDNIQSLERYDEGQNMVDATNNWWGSIHSPENQVTGSVLYFPWSLEKHKKKDTLCCSNILFVPGLMGSRLYTGGIFENQLWEPNRNADVKKLFLDKEGKSLHDIYTRDIIGKTNIAGGVSFVDQDIYRGFTSYMDGLVKKDTITSWESSPYDWRYTPDTLLEDGIISGTKKSHKADSLVEKVKSLAKNSKTKKVTIITHSNGGLVAKQLMIALKNENLDTVIDKIIFVASPEFGTPQAITGLLYGHDQSIGGGVILKSSVAKELGQNMPTAYSLLPSDMYFQHKTQTLKFLGTTMENSSQLQEKLFAYDFVNKKLFNKAKELHQSIDNWRPNPNLQILNIVGTGVLTVSGLVSVKGKKGSEKFIPEYSSTGDGVVQLVDGRLGKVVMVDLTNSEYKHANIMNAPKVQDKIKDFIQNTNSVHIVSEGAPLPVISYKLLKISPTENLIGKNIQLKSMYVEDENPISTSKFKYDKYIAGYSTYFDTVNEQTNQNRFELFGDDVHYLYMNKVNNITVSEGGGYGVDIDMFKKENNQLTQVIFDSIPNEQGAEIVINNNNTLAVSIPLINQSILISPTKEVIYDNPGHIVNEQVFATSTESILEKIMRIKLKIKSSNITPYIKDRYIRALDGYQKVSTTLYIEGMIQRVTRAIASLNTFSNKPLIWGRYKKQRQDYIYLKYLFAPLLHI